MSWVGAGWTMVAMVTALGVAGCSSAVDSQPDPEACTMGAFWGDCGCDGEPVLACTDDERRCRWFVGGCTPSGYRTSPCSAEDICCVDDWPFEGTATIAVHEQLYAWGLEPWNAERETKVSVELDSAVETHSAELSCAGVDKPGTPCGDSPRTERAYHGGSFAVYLQPETWDLEGWYLVVETLDGDERAARACRLRYTDSSTRSCSKPPIGGTDYRPTCASDGTLTLSAMPENAGELEDVHGTLTATFPEGVFEARF